MPSLILKEICGVPKYRQLAGIIRKDIVSGQLKVGDKLLSIRELASYYQTTKVTVSQAVEQLAKEGLIEQQQGRGVFVKRARLSTAAVVFDQKIFDSSGTRYCMCLLSALEAFFRERGWGCKYFLNLSDSSLEEFEHAMVTRQFDGVVIDSRSTIEHAHAQALAVGVKCVSVVPVPVMEYWATFDYCQMAWRATEALIQMGCRRIGLITGSQEYPNAPRPDVGYVRALEDNGLAVDRSIMQSVPFSEKDGFQVFNKLWTETSGVDGLVVTDELIMRGIVRAIVSRGVRVPDQLKIASQVIKDQDHPFAIPVIEMQCNVVEQATVVGRMLIDLVEGTLVENPKVRLIPNVHNPY